MRAIDWTLLILLALPLIYFVGVGITVTAGVLFSGWVRRMEAHAMDAEQKRAFGELELSLGRRVRGVLVETYYQALVFALQGLHGLRLLPAPPARPDQTPVVLLHGYTENSGAMWWLARRLAAAGFNPILVDFPSTLRRIEDNARFLAEQIAEIRARHGGEPVAIVAHSMGGLVTRTLVLDAEAHGVGVLVAIASPFRGTQLASLSKFLPLGRSVRQMRPGHPYLERFPPSVALPVPVLSVVARQETIVSPEWSVVIAGAQICVIDQPYGHAAPLFLAAAFVEIERFLLGNAVTRQQR
jgi:pimeloyl-ACP methyl ester carboxylesterase